MEMQMFDFRYRHAAQKLKKKIFPAVNTGVNVGIMSHIQNISELERCLEAICSLFPGKVPLRSGLRFDDFKSQLSP
jgi:hypothetical protein